MKNTIKEHRKLKNLTQEELSQKAGLSRVFLATVETGIAVPSVKNAL